MNKKVIMTGTLGVMTEESRNQFKKLLKERVPDAEYVFLYDEPQEDGIIMKEAKSAAVIVTQFQQMNADIYEALLPELRGVIAYGIGYNCADVTAATEKGIMVGNIPDYCTDEVANHAATLLLCMQRRIPGLIKWVEEGKWSGGYKVIAPKKRFADSTVGLFGFGKIPKTLAKMMLGFGVKVIAYDPYVQDKVLEDAGVVPVTFDELLKESDYLSLHAPAVPSTIGIMNKEAFVKMKPSAVLINTSRGALVNVDDLYRALTTGVIDSAALDAYITEPPLGLEHKILELPNVLSTPHVGYYSDTAFYDLMVKTIDEIARILDGKAPCNLVNPQVLKN